MSLHWMRERKGWGWRRRWGGGIRVQEVRSVVVVVYMAGEGGV